MPDVSILLVAQDTKERGILQTALEMKGFRVRSFEPSSNGFLQMEQYRPEIVFMEMSKNFADQVMLLRTAISNAGKLGSPIVGYGSHEEQSVIRRFILAGLKRYHKRPLKLGHLLKDMEEFLGYRNLKFLPNRITPEKKEQDFSDLLDSSKPGYEKLDIMRGHVEKLLSFPFIVSKVLEITDDDDKGAAELAKAIQGDSSLMVTVLKVANSAFFKSETDRRITRAQEAIVRIGFDETKNICLSQKLLNLFDQDSREFGFDRIDFWVHSIGCGLISEKLAKETGYNDPHKAFMAGLLHELGILLFDEYFADIFERVLAETSTCGQGVCDAELRVLGVSHNELLARLFEDWQMPAEIREAIRYHLDFHQPDLAIHPRAKKLASIIGLANLMAKSMDLGNSCDGYVHAVSDDVLRSFGITCPLPEDFLKDIHDEIESFAKFLGLEDISLDDSGDIFSEGKKTFTLVIDMAPSFFNPIFSYLKHNGYELEVLEDHKKLGEKAGDFDLLIFHTDFRTSFEDFRTLQKMILDDNGVVKVPVLVFWDGMGPLEKIREVGPLRKALKNGDLRNVVQLACTVTEEDGGLQSEIIFTEA